MDVSPSPTKPSSSPEAPSAPSATSTLRGKPEPFGAVNSLLEASKISAMLSPVATSCKEPSNSMISPLDETLNWELEPQRRRYKDIAPSPEGATGKRKHYQVEEEPSPSGSRPSSSRRKSSGDFLRKGHWTATEEKLAKKLVEAFTEGYLPIYTGIRLRGYLAVQLQCDPMRVSKKLCVGTLDGKTIPKNYGQKKFKLRKQPLWDCKVADRIMAELDQLTKLMWSETRLRKPAYLTLSSTRNMGVRRGRNDLESATSPSSPAKRGSPPPTPKTKKHKVFPIIYLNLSKKKTRPMNALDEDSTDPASPSDSDSEPVNLDGESLQAANDLLTLCRPDATP